MRPTAIELTYELNQVRGVWKITGRTSRNWSISAQRQDVGDAALRILR